jgi:ubiquinone/menaquinone biosynthesis C-methylase UbiE
MNYINHFNNQSDQYLLFRPTYPESLYKFLATLVSKRGCVWDCATGSGQAALTLTKYFDLVLATDINREQLDEALGHRSIHYLCCAAENTPIQSNTVDLITVAQALHWFNLELFYQEVCRVAKPSAFIAAWCYSLGSINTEIDPLIKHLYYDILGDTFWPAERRFIDEAYQTIPFPFEKISTPSFAIEKELTFNQFFGYLRTWSAVKEYQKQTKTDPLLQLQDELRAAWGSTETHTMHWPLYLLVGQIKQSRLC